MIEVNKELEDYILQHTETEDLVLKDLTRETHVKMLRPRMLSGHLQGKFLKMTCQMIRPLRILEIGTYTGYSAISMAMGTSEDCIIHTIDCNDELEQFTRKYIKRSGFENRIQFHIGDALEMIPKLEEDFDLVFIDADKRQYIEYFEAVFPKLNKGGFILADDVLWDGKVVEEIENNDKQTQGIINFNHFIQEDSRVENLILPIRHGLMMIRKK
ncbi:O-methyltransferase [Labilibaculum euxinus]|uniref:Methyltransferase domain-containing protein n=1 Tax=Labilibaculum euxinus TaxID=2686357 RepID=A0A7M4D372_9BACT|nr:O-methyltransferase [Labilibaculum euxinus]MUP37101.1 methyltransferase domain-containing protein [Labilibaculum euxinus]MVB06306.1 methyltransferase domain-containing protein [Labilibaculum euxinus]